MIRQQVTEYVVCAIPEDDIDAPVFEVRVAYRGRGKWAVLRSSGQCLDADGNWGWEWLPSERTDEWLATHRFDVDTALQLAAEVAPNIVVNGRTAADVLAASEQESFDHPADVCSGTTAQREGNRT